MEIKLRNELSNIVLAPTNNDKKILGTINTFVDVIKFKCDGGLAHWHDVTENGFLNTRPLGTKILTNVRRNRDYFTADKAMGTLISTIF